MDYVINILAYDFDVEDYSKPSTIGAFESCQIADVHIEKLSKENKSICYTKHLAPVICEEHVRICRLSLGLVMDEITQIISPGAIEVDKERLCNHRLPCDLAVVNGNLSINIFEFTDVFNLSRQWQLWIAFYNYINGLFLQKGLAIAYETALKLMRLSYAETKELLSLSD